MSSNKKILIIDEMHRSISDMLVAIGYEPHYQPKITRSEIKNLKDEYVGMIVRSKTPIDQDLIQEFNQLKFIARAGSGLDNLQKDYLDEKGIEVVNAPEGNRDALGEHVIGMLFSLSNNLGVSDQQVRDMVWSREANRGFEIGGKVVALLGYGHMGSAVAEKLTGFGCEVIAYDNNKFGYSNQYVREANMQEVFEKADIFSLHVPLDSSNKDLVDLAYLHRFKKDIVFINAARGEVVVTADLLNALESGKVTHAALDVLENEKLQTLTEAQQKTYKRLFELPNVLLSPHIGGWSFESYENINRVLVEKIAKLDI